MKKLLSGLLLLVATPLLAGEATFSPDGSSVFFVDIEGAKLKRVDLEIASVTPLEVSPKISSPIIAVACTNDRLVLVLEREFWHCSFDGTSFKQLLKLPEGSRWLDVAWDPATELLYATMEVGEEFRLVRFTDFVKGKYQPVGCRRARPDGGFSFTPSGEMLFSMHGDAWLGNVQKEEEEEERYDLLGFRWAPVATLETYPGTPSQMGSTNIVCGANKVYAHVRRLGGSGWGYVVRLKQPPKMAEFDAEREENELVWRSKLSATALTSLEPLAENGTLAYLCASRDGKRIFYQGTDLKTSEGGFFLIENDGEGKLLELPVE